MFREMRRGKQKISEEKCAQILREEPRGVLSLIGDNGYPYGLPIDFFYDEKSCSIYFHCAKEGHKIDAIDKDCRASFCVWDQGFRKDGDWALNINSVIVFGRIEIIKDKAKSVDILRSLGHKYYPQAEDVEKEIAGSGARALILQLKIEHMTGKLVNES